MTIDPTVRQFEAYLEAIEKFTDWRDLEQRLRAIVQFPRLTTWLMAHSFTVGERTAIDLDARSPSGVPWREYLAGPMDEELGDFGFDREQAHANLSRRRLSTVKKVSYGNGEATTILERGPMSIACTWRTPGKLADPPNAEDFVGASLFWEPVFLPPVSPLN
jgi:hypothetical protein